MNYTHTSGSAGLTSSDLNSSPALENLLFEHNYRVA